MQKNTINNMYKDKINNFLNKYKHSIDFINKEDFINSFMNKMNKGLIKESKLPMLPTYIFENIKINNHNKHLLIDAGGTHLRFALGYIDNNNYCHIQKLADLDMIGKVKEYTKDEFYDELAKIIKNLNVSFDNIGFCFSFACQMNERLDGKVIRFGKDLRLDKVINSYVAKETLKALHSNNINVNKQTNIYIINDTVASLLGSIIENKKVGNYIGYILGTGTNGCYFENTNNITKLNININERMIINIESSNFDSFHTSDIENIVLDKLGYDHKFEKVSGGLYFKLILNESLNLLNKEGLINLKKEASYALRDYSHFLENSSNPIIDNIESNNVNFLKEFLIEMIKFNAYRNALMITAILNQSNNSSEINYLGIEGSTYNKTPYMKKYIQEYILELNKDKEIKFVEGEGLNLKGALLIASIK